MKEEISPHCHCTKLPIVIQSVLVPGFVRSLSNTPEQSDLRLHNNNNERKRFYEKYILPLNSKCGWAIWNAFSLFVMAIKLYCDEIVKNNKVL